jgi:7-cyano-7-deazaguanine synthase
MDVPEGHYEAESMKATVVPNRNAIMISIAYGHAVSIGAETVGVGVHAGDHAIYPDCRAQFIDMLSSTLQVGNDSDLRIYAPFIDKTKSDIVKYGTALGVPFDLTWSCYKGLEKHCGRCGTCVERKEAFQLAGVNDPTEYDYA